MSELESKTKLYWALARAYYKDDGPLKGINFEQASRELGNLEETTGPNRKLCRKVSRLYDELIGIKPEKEANGVCLPFDAA